MRKMIIAVLGGGYSSEKEISSKSASFVYGELCRTIYEPYLVIIERKRWYVLLDNGVEIEIDKNDFSFVTDGRKIKPEYVINIIHGTPGENGILNGYLDLMDIPYVGCDTLTSAVTFDKVWTKRILAETGIPMAKDCVVVKGDVIDTDAIIARIGFPMFIKPTASGSSFGITKVKTKEEILPALEYAFTESDMAIIEEFIAGREMACGIYVTKKGVHLLPPTEIISENEFFDYQAKYQGASKEVTPAQVSQDIIQKMNEYTLKIYKHSRCRGFVRVDYIVKDEIPYLIEINSIPGMSAQSLLPQQLQCAGITVNEMVTEIINN